MSLVAVLNEAGRLSQDARNNLFQLLWFNTEEDKVTVPTTTSQVEIPARLVIRSERLIESFVLPDEILNVRREELLQELLGYDDVDYCTDIKCVVSTDGKTHPVPYDMWGYSSTLKRQDKIDVPFTSKEIDNAIDFHYDRSCWGEPARKFALAHFLMGSRLVDYIDHCDIHIEDVRDVLSSNPSQLVTDAYMLRSVGQCVRYGSYSKDLYVKTEGKITVCCLNLYRQCAQLGIDVAYRR